MPTGKTSRRPLSPPIKDRFRCGNGGASRGLTMLLNGRGAKEVAFAVKKDYEQQNVHPQQHNYGSSLTSFTGYIAGPGKFSSAPSNSDSLAPSNSDNLLSIAGLPLAFPLPCLRIFGRKRGSMDRPQKSSRGMFWKRPMLHLVLSLVLGIVMGATSLSWLDSPFYTRDEAPRDLALVNGFDSNLQREGFKGQGLETQQSGSQDSRNTVTQGQILIENDSMRVYSGFGEDGHMTRSEKTSRASQLEQLKFASSDLAPSLNYTLDPERKLLIIVTPTYNRPFQAYYLTRLAHTLRRVPPPLLWLVVEMTFQTLETASVLMQTGIMYRHLVCTTNDSSVIDRVVHQRNFALRHIEKHQLDGVVHFADDDNVYLQNVFEEMRKISRFGTWLVAMLREGKEKTLLEGPVCDEERVIGWHTYDRAKRSTPRFHVDISGFAFNSTILWDTENWRHRGGQPIRQMDTVQEGLQVSTFIEQLVEDEDQMHGFPSGCRKIMVWHLDMEAPKLPYPYGWYLAQTLFPNIPLPTQT